jgi:hypothetical protein
MLVSTRQKYRGRGKRMRFKTREQLTRQELEPGPPDATSKLAAHKNTRQDRWRVSG